MAAVSCELQAGYVLVVAAQDDQEVPRGDLGRAGHKQVRAGNGVHQRENLPRYMEKGVMTTAPREGMGENDKAGEGAGPFRSSWTQDQTRVFLMVIVTEGSHSLLG